MNRRIGFVGLGYAGFPMAYLFSKKHPIVGFDSSSARIADLNAGFDATQGVSSDEIHEMLQGGTVLTDDLDQLRGCDFFIITVPTPVDDDDNPDFSCLVSASRKVGQVMQKGAIVIYASTVYPGATEEVCVPVLEETSGMTCNKDFAVGYSPERVNPGDAVHTPANIVKVISASTPETLSVVFDVYEQVFGKDGIYAASSIKVAEACKVLENTQRDVNIALMNEAAKVFDAMGISTHEVIDAMNTKWNALGFRPGLVGGHCISVDPYYLIQKAKSLGIDANLMSEARRINNAMPEFVVQHTLSKLRNETFPNTKLRVLLLGVTFKENCPDVRNTKVKDIYRQLIAHQIDTVVFDPVADPKLVEQVMDMKIVTAQSEMSDSKFNAILLCVSHDQFRDFDFKAHLVDGGFVYDIKNMIPTNKKQNIKLIKL